MASARIGFASTALRAVQRRRDLLNQLRGLLDDELLSAQGVLSLFSLGRTIVKMLNEQIGD